MKRALLLSACLISSLCACSRRPADQTEKNTPATHNPAPEKNARLPCKNLFYQGYLPQTPQQDTLICHSRIAVALNPSTHLADYSAEYLTGESGPGTRDTEFTPDPNAPAGAQIDSRTYSHSGYDRGHLSPAADFKQDPQAMHESFYTSNVAPQNQTLNREAWAGLESAVRSCARHEKGVYVLTGVSVGNHPQYIGKQQRIPVPSSFWKIILSPHGYRAFIYPNVALGKNTPSSLYGVNLSNFERATGIRPIDETTANQLPRTLCKREFGP